MTAPAPRLTCPDCGHIHTTGDARAIGLFQPSGPRYRAASGGPLRSTRAEAVADECRKRVER